MKYKEFCKKIEPLTVPTPKQIDTFCKSENSSHVSLKWHISGMPSEVQLQMFVDTIELIESRGGVREVDYIVVAGSLDVQMGEFFTVQLHSINNFISDEDFGSEVTRK